MLCSGSNDILHLNEDFGKWVSDVLECFLTQYRKIRLEYFCDNYKEEDDRETEEEGEENTIVESIKQQEEGNNIHSPAYSGTSRIMKQWKRKETLQIDLTNFSLISSILLQVKIKY